MANASEKRAEIRRQIINAYGSFDDVERNIARMIALHEVMAQRHPFSWSYERRDFDPRILLRAALHLVQDAHRSAWSNWNGISSIGLLEELRPEFVDEHGKAHLGRDGEDETKEDY